MMQTVQLLLSRISSPDFYLPCFIDDANLATFTMESISVYKRIPLSFCIALVKQIVMNRDKPHSTEVCNQNIAAVRDALYVLNGKWKIPLIVSLMNGPRRFKEIQRELKDITPKVLSKELRELEQNEFVTRKVFNTVPVSVIYELTEYSKCLDGLIEALAVFGLQHRERIIGGKRTEEIREMEAAPEAE